MSGFLEEFQSPIGRVSGCNSLMCYERARRAMFQSPIGRVSGCNPRRFADWRRGFPVSVPYWSGQWLQRGSASHRGRRSPVSVPYWSGQWLQRSRARCACPRTAFQSPIGRVSGCNMTSSSVRPRGEGFSPLLVGSVVATDATRRARCASARFQSPIGRVSGCNGLPRQQVRQERGFQSPIGRVSGCNRRGVAMPQNEGVVSVPYWSGQWLQPANSCSNTPGGSVSVPYWSGQWLQRSSSCRRSLPNRVSVPYWSGQWLQPLYFRTSDSMWSRFSPLLVGSVVATVRHAHHRRRRSRFSPLLVGSVVATVGARLTDGFNLVSVPYWSGQWLQPRASDTECASPRCFSPLLVGSVVATSSTSGDIASKRVSVPYWSGQWLQPEHPSPVGQACPRVSVPYWSGQWLQPGRAPDRHRR